MDVYPARNARRSDLRCNPNHGEVALRVLRAPEDREPVRRVEAAT